MGRFILGVHASHNASAAIGDESGILHAVQEERLTGEKNYWGFPKQSILACLKHAGAQPSDLLGVAYGGKQVLIRYHGRDDVLKAYQRNSTLAGKFRQRVAVPIALAVMPRLGQGDLQAGLAEVGLNRVPLTHYDHHLTHAGAAYYGLRDNPERKHLVLTCDGSGDALRHGAGNGRRRESPGGIDPLGQLARRAVLVDHVPHGVCAPGARIQADGHGALRLGAGQRRDGRGL